MNKKCNRCGEDKDISLYYRNKASKDGLQSICKDCKNVVNANWKENNPDKYKEVKRKAHIKSKYGVDEAWVDARLEANEHKCPLCSTPVFKGKNIAIDHCHETGVVRDVICRKCNSAMGMFSDNPELLNKVLDYLDRDDV